MTETDNSPGLATCAGCGGVIRGDLERCSLCTGVAPPPCDDLPPLEDLPTHTPNRGLTHPYRPPGTLAIALRMMFTAWLILESFALGSLIVLYRIVDALAHNPFAYTNETFTTQLSIWDSMLVVEIGFGVVLAFLFISWMFRAYGNLPALGGYRATSGRGWAIGGWFVPIGNLFIPKGIANEIWTSPDHTTRGGIGWRPGPVDVRIHIWWATFILGRVAFSISNMLVDDASLPGEVRNATVLAIAGVVVTMVSAVLAIWYVTNASVRQTAAVKATGRPVADRDATWRLKWHLAAIPVLVIAVAVAGYLIFRVGPPLGQAGTAQGDGTALYEGYGIAFEYDGSFSAAENGLFGTTPTEDDGAVYLASPDQTEIGFVTWFGLVPTSYDLETAVDGTIDGTSEAFGTGPGIVRSEAIDLPEGPTVFLAKTFRIDGDGGIASGAVAAGRCARDQRLVTIMFAVDGRLDFDRPGEQRQNPSMQNLIAILATLDC